MNQTIVEESVSWFKRRPNHDTFPRLTPCYNSRAVLKSDNEISLNKIISMVHGLFINKWLNDESISSVNIQRQF